MPFDSKNDAGHTIVSIDETRLDASLSEPLRIYLFDQIDNGSDNLVIDLSQVRFMDSSGLGALVAGLKKMGGAGSMKLASAQPAVMDLFSLTSMDKLFTILPTVTEAIKEK
ncbi:MULTISPECIES: STAS domain-containing protein [Gammaproteobacteria]|uniref:STAS domain-containing protein n=1 Tax=Gammaproteobacteria TaxID=1236 RepID=UPI000C78A4DB|nr:MULTISPECIES: STAS domain-containing protein [Gammaproteobacteria]MBO9481483.1 STAS domain-containing protein [Salinisphaera sp. G21_0]MBO9496042.1 STAS domain-containing protein [Thalassotalea sp. G20_0]WBA83928.1 STAS domain-containing protein [Endozoicomonas sp. GU-1]WBA86910.1 STAS domain-containing protein [Endozoicomonas sp. GU-1]